MARGRELVAKKVTGQQRNDIRWKEVADGKLSLPREPRALYVLTGTGFDAASGKVTDSYLRWVIYVPYATPQSTGLSTKSSDNAPWLMSPGTAGAHIFLGAVVRFTLRSRQIQVRIANNARRHVGRHVFLAAANDVVRRQRR